MNVRKATSEDYLILANLGSKTFYDTWRPVNTEDDMQLYIKNSFDPAKIKTDIENESVNTFLLVFDGENAVGYVKLRCDRTYKEFDNQSAIEIERIYVLKECQGKKFGKALMDESLRIASDKNYKWIWLGVNVDNVKAINFYRKYDFTVFGEKSFQLGDAVDTDYLMKKKLAN